MLSGIVGIVSGGASGLGAAAARCIARNGGKVVVGDLSNSQETFLEMISQDSTLVLQDNIVFSEMDVTESDQISQALDLAESTFGQPVNVAVSCAGICPAKKTISTIHLDQDGKGSNNRNNQNILYKPHSEDLFSNTMHVNVTGTFNLSRLAAERMISRQDMDDDDDNLKGCIINTASIAAYEGQRGQVAYAASKGAVVGMTLPMARDLAPHGIRVMTIAPGLFQTALLDGLPPKVKAELGASVPCPSRLGNPDEFGHLIMSIITNPMLNGEVIRLDGAVRMPP